MAVLAAYAVPHPPIIIPGVGNGKELTIADTIASYEEVAKRIVSHKPDTIVVISPHAPSYPTTFAICDEDRLQGDLSQFHDKDDTISQPVDVEFCKALERGARIQGIPAKRKAWKHHDLDHAAFIPLYFINQVYTDFKVVEIGISGLSADQHFELGEIITQTAEWLGRRVVYVASGDWSHKLTEDGPYGFAPEGPRFDAVLKDCFFRNDLTSLFTMDEAMVNGAAECGLRPFQVIAGALESVRHTSEVLSYEGPFGVGYGVVALEVE